MKDPNFDSWMEISQKLKDLNIECCDLWNNRYFYIIGSLCIMNHQCAFYWQTNDRNTMNYDYPIKSIAYLEKIMKLYEKFDFYKQNPEKVTLKQYNDCLKEIRGLRKELKSH